MQTDIPFLSIEIAIDSISFSQFDIRQLFIQI